MKQNLIHFSLTDGIGLIVFALAIAGIGLFTRTRKNNFVEYLAAGRSLTAPAMVMTLVSTWYGGVLGVGESISYYGIGCWLLLGLPYYVFAIIYAYWLAGKVREGDDLSIPQRLFHQYGPSVGLIGASLIFLLGTPAANLYMLAVLVHLLTGITTSLCIFISGVLGIVFLWRGGLLADVRLGIVAFIATYFGFIVIDLVCFAHQPLITAIHQLPGSNLKKIDGGQGIFAFMSFFILGAWTLVDPGFHQRVTSSAAPGIAKKGVLIATLCFMVSDFLTMSAGIYAIDRLQPLPKNHVAIFPIFANQILPNGLKAIFFIGLLGVTVSSHVGYTLVSGATMGRDIIAPAIKKVKQFDETQISKFGLIITTLVGGLIALWVHSVLAIWYTWTGILIGALLIPVLASYQRFPSRNLPQCALIAGMLSSFITSLAWMIYGMSNNNPELNVTYHGHSFSLGTMIPALTVSIIVTYSTANIVWKLNRPMLETSTNKPSNQ